MNAKRLGAVIITLALVTGCDPSESNPGGERPDVPTTDDFVKYFVYGGEAGQSKAFVEYRTEAKTVKEEVDLPWSVTVRRSGEGKITARVLSGNADQIECEAHRGTQSDSDTAKFVIGNQVTCRI